MILPHTPNRIPTKSYFWPGYVIDLLFDESLGLWIYRFIYYHFSTRRKGLPDLMWWKGFSSQEETMKTAEFYVGQLLDR